MRSLVSRLSGRGRSILLTTHDMREAEQLSQRVVMMKDGRVLAESTASGLRQAAADRLGHTVRVQFADGRVPAQITACPGLLDVTHAEDAVTLRVTNGARAAQWIIGIPAETSSIAIAPPTLEEVFLDMVVES
jgi:ABC-2 type transport system ATP-binding protein